MYQWEHVGKDDASTEWIVNFSLLGGAVSRSYLGGLLRISSQAAALWLRTEAGNWLHRTEVWFSLTNWESFLFSWLMPDLSLGHFYTQEPSKNIKTNKNNVSKFEMHGELIHRNQQSIRSWVTFAKHNCSDSSKFKVNMSFNTDKRVVKLCTSQGLSLKRECLDAL